MASNTRRRSTKTGAASRRAPLRVPGIGEKKRRALAARGIRDRAGLRRVAAELPAVARAALRHRVERRVSRREAEAVTRGLRRRLRFGPDGPRRYPIRVVGSLRRRAPWASDIDLLVVVPDGAQLEGLLAGATLAPPRARATAARGAGTPPGLRLAETYAVGARRRSMLVAARARGRVRHYAVDLFVATRSELPYALLAYSGPREYVVRLRAHAKRRGLLLNQYGLYSAKSSRPVPATAAARAKLRTERDVLKYLGASYRTPARRGEEAVGGRAAQKSAGY